ncbi:hypothetical protein SprV_0401580500 [Sparganum proliferum]
MERTYVDGTSEGRRINLQSQPHQRCQSQTRSTQISTVAAASQRQLPIASNVSTMSTDISDANQTYWTPSDQLRHPDCINYRLSVNLSIASHAVIYR